MIVPLRQRCGSKVLMSSKRSRQSPRRHALGRQALLAEEFRVHADDEDFFVVPSG